MASRRDQTLTEPSGAAAGLAVPSPYLVVVLECDRPLEGSSRHALRGLADVALGRGDKRASARSGASLALTVPGAWMSIEHARFTVAGGRWVLEDIGSHNGTLVNGAPVVHHALDDGDVVEAGRTLLIFRAALHGPASTPADLDTGTTPAGALRLGTLLPALAAETDALAQVARSDLPVLLRGETGTGKEIAARAVHEASGRKGPLVAINCGALPPALAESQLFGHVKGAFSGAVRDEKGFVRAAEGGTLFLDEVGDLAPSSQAALLRVLQERQVTPVGSTRAEPADVRVVAATHQPIEALIARGSFRADLLARLAGFTFSLPPLRERREDLGLLAGELLRKQGARGLTVAPDAARALLGYDWPLNVRELGHALARAQALGGEGRIEIAHLPPEVRAAVAAPATPQGASDARLKAQLEDLLVRHEGDLARVARSLGKARMQVYRWLKRFGLDANRYRPH